MNFFKSNSIFHLAISALLALSLTACGGGSGSSEPNVSVDTPDVAARDLQQIIISPFIDSVPKGSQVNFSTTGIYSDQTSEDISSQVNWGIDDETVATVDSDGKVSPIKAGVVKVTASYQGLNSERILTVTSATLDSIQINPQQVDVNSGLQKVYQAMGNFSDGSSLDVSDQVVWTSSNKQVVEMSSTLATAKNPGAAIITATMNGVSDKAGITVNAAALQRIEISLSNSELEVALKSQLTVLGFYSDQSAHEVTEQVTWSVDDNSIASIDKTTSSVEATAAGTTTLRANFSGFSANAQLQVTDAVLTGIEISPKNITLVAGLQHTFSATGIYSNQQSRDLTQQVIWQSSTTNIADIDNRLLSKGEVSTFSKGHTIISAHFMEQSGSAELTVTDAELISIEVTPADLKLAKGLQQQFVATAYYSDGSSQPVTDQVTWITDNSNIMLTGTDSSGLFELANKGNSLVIASLNGKQGYTNLEITEATLDSLNIVSSANRMAIGTTQRLTAYAHYSDGGTVDVTNQVSWISSDNGLATIGNTSSDQAVVTGLSSGNVTITIQLNGIQTSTDIEITSATLQLIQITLAAQPLFIDQQREIQALGTYSDGSQQIINQQLHWQSSNDAVVSISNGGTEKGLISALTEGESSIVASLSGVSSNSLLLEVIDNPDYPASVALSASPNVILNDGMDSTTLQAKLRPLQAHGVIADNTQVNFVIVENGVARVEIATTIDGVASLNLTSLNSGFILVTAEVDNTDLNAATAIFSTDNFVRVLQVIPLSNATLLNNNTLYQKGSVFALFMRNLSNRDFKLLEFQMKNGTEYLPNLPVTDSAYLSGGVLEGGEYTGAGYQLDNDTTNNTISAGFILSDDPSKKLFGFTINFNTF